jgi:L-ascorbate metabolism protein UlaG (beta-lactamase superfamily)
MLTNIHWLGHATFLIKVEFSLYIDPFRVPANLPPADVILITHEHYDHFSPSDIERISRKDTQIITNQRIAEQLPDTYNIVTLRPWQSVNIQQANIKATPAYTLDDYHPAVREDLGFVIALNRYDIYYAGDTDFVPDLRSLRCDIAILPVSAKEGLMTVEETVAFVKSLQPQVVIPSHYGTAEGGNLIDAKALETALGELAEVHLLSAGV